MDSSHIHSIHMETHLFQGLTIVLVNVHVLFLGSTLLSWLNARSFFKAFDL